MSGVVPPREGASMVQVAAPRFDLDECNSEAEGVLIEALHARADAGGWCADVWRVWDDRLTLSVCPSDDDPEYNCVLRTLRVDFDGTTVRFGPDETGQFATDLDPTRSEVSVLSGGPITEAGGRGSGLAGTRDAAADRAVRVELARRLATRMGASGHGGGIGVQRLGQRPRPLRTGVASSGSAAVRPGRSNGPRRRRCNDVM